MAQPSRQAGVEIEITEEMIEAAIVAYDAWEMDAVFDEGVSPYAKRELAMAIFRAMACAETSRAPARNG